jgi:hypothetical protein
VLHHPVGHREVGRGVVELHVAHEGRPPGEHHRGREDREDAETHADAHGRGRSRHERDSSSPTIARATTSGPASYAVASVSVANCAARITTVSPAGGSSGRGSRDPEASSSRAPQPSESPTSRSGNATQATSSAVS